MLNSQLQRHDKIEEDGFKESTIRHELYVRTPPPVKYIIFTINDLLEVPVVFPSMANHSDVRRAFPEWTPIAAGFYDAKRGCYGISDSLQLDSRSKDTEIIRRYFRETATHNSQC